MSFASILSGPAEETPRKPASPVQTFKPIEPAPIAPALKVEPEPTPDTIRRNHYDPTQEHRSVDQTPTNGTADKTSQMPPPSRRRKVVPERERESVANALERLEDMETSDTEMQGFEDECQRYLLRGKKRAHDVEGAESKKRKVSGFLSTRLFWFSAY